MKRVVMLGAVLGAMLTVAACGDARAPMADAGARDEAASGPSMVAAEEPRRVVYVDVRRPDEWAQGRVDGAIHLPLSELAERWAELDAHRDDEIVLYCRTGNRSGQALRFLEDRGFENLVNGGGIHELEREGVPVTR